MNKIKEMFVNMSYRKKYNALKIKYESLLENLANNSLESFKNLNAINNNLKTLKKDCNSLKDRVSSLELKNKK